MMKILIHDYSGHPFQVQLSRELSKRKHQVLHLYSDSFQTPHGNLIKGEYDSANFFCKAIKLNAPFKKYSYIKRRFQEIKYGKLLVKEIDKFNPQIVISSNTPLDTQDIIQSYCKTKNIRFIFWLQDLYGIAITRILSRRFLVLGYIIGQYYKNMENKLLRNSDAIVSITDDFIPILKNNGITDKKVYVVNNWAPIKEIPLHNKANHWSKKYALDNKVCVLYAGTLGMKHNPQLLLNTAIDLKSINNVNIVVISEGPGADFLKTKKYELELDNLLILNFQPFKDFSYVLASGDILLTILEKHAGIFCVPSKVLTYMCSGRAIIASIPKENLAARIINNYKAGIVVDPENNDDFIKSVRKLIFDYKLRNEYALNARRYAVEKFEIESIGDQFEEIAFKFR